MNQKYTTERLIFEIQNYAKGRTSDVERGAETPRFAALLLQKYGYGMIDAIRIMTDNDRSIDTSLLYKILDEEVEKIDPKWQEHMKERWEARPVDIKMDK